MISCILLPVDDYDEALKFYIEVVDFHEIDGLLYPPGEDKGVGVQVQIVTEETREKYSLLNRIRFPLFRYEITEGFVEYCDRARRHGAEFDLIIDHPGGYFARIRDPFGNHFEVECESWN